MKKEKKRSPQRSPASDSNAITARSLAHLVFLLGAAMKAGMAGPGRRETHLRRRRRRRRRSGRRRGKERRACPRRGHQHCVHLQLRGCVVSCAVSSTAARVWKSAGFEESGENARKKKSDSTTKKAVLNSTPSQLLSLSRPPCAHFPPSPRQSNHIFTSTKQKKSPTTRDRTGGLGMTDNFFTYRR